MTVNNDAPILIVEDVVSNQIFLSSVLKKLGFGFEIADNGQICVDMFKTNKYSLIFMDVTMPVMDGVEATKIIRTMKHGDIVPIVALTANAMKEHKDKCMNAGMNDYLTKPVKISTVSAVLDKWMPKTEFIACSDEVKAHSSLNLDTLSEIKSIDEDGSIINEIRNAFELAYKTYLMDIAEALNSKDLEKIRVLTHKLVAPADTIGAELFSAICRSISQCKKTDDVPNFLKELEEEFVLVQKAIKKEFDKPHEDEAN